MNDMHVDDQIDLYALGALEPNEQMVVDEHLDTCVRCRTRLEEAKRLVALLAWTPDQHEPPPALRDRVVRHARQTRQPVTNQHWWQRFDPGAWGWTRPRRIAGFGLAAAALILALLGNTFRLQRHVARLQSEVMEPQVAQLLRTPGARLVVLLPQASGSTGTGQMLMNNAGTQGYLVTDALPPLPTDKAYQLWMIGSAGPTNAGVFTVDQQGVATVLVNIPGQAQNYQATGVTVEPAGGSPQPTSDPILLTEL